MSHPHNQHRDHKVQKSRVAHLTKGYASGGSVSEHHDDEENDKKLIEKSVKKTALKAEGSMPKHRADRRARGGRTKSGKGKTVVNIINSPGPKADGAPMPPVMAPHPPMAAGAPPPQMPPGMPPGGMPPGGMPPHPMGGPPMMPGGVRKYGGRTYAKGGAVKDGPAWKEGLRDGTQVQHSPGKNDLADIGRKKPVTYAKGGAVPAKRLVQFYAGGKVESPQGVAPATKLPGGGGGAKARLAKEKRAARDYARA